MFIRKIVALFYLISLPLLSLADASAQDLNYTAFRKWFTQHVEISALVEQRTAFGTNKWSGQKAEVLFMPELEIALSHGLDLTAIGRLRSDAFDKLEPGDGAQSEVAHFSRHAVLGDRIDFELREFYLETTVGRSFLTLGKQQIVWGKADGLKVLDVVNPQDFREFILDDFDESRIPLWAVNAEIPVGAFVAQLLWISERTYHDIPEAGAAFAFTAPALGPVAPPGIPVELQQVKRPHRFFADSDAGIRLSTFWKGWDLTINYFYHYQDIPVLFRSVAISDGKPLITIRPRYKRSHLMGGTFSNAFGPLTVRGEIGYSTNRFFATADLQNSDGVEESGELAYVLGFDWFGVSETLISLQLFQNWVTGNFPGLIRDRFDTKLSLLLQRDFLRERLKMETLWVQNVNQGDGMLRPMISYELYDNVKLWTGFDLFYGSRHGLFGQFDRNDRLAFGVEWGI